MMEAQKKVEAVIEAQRVAHQKEVKGVDDANQLAQEFHRREAQKLAQQLAEEREMYKGKVEEANQLLQEHKDAKDKVLELSQHLQKLEAENVELKIQAEKSEKKAYQSKLLEEKLTDDLTAAEQAYKAKQLEFAAESTKCQKQAEEAKLRASKIEEEGAMHQKEAEILRKQQEAERSCAAEEIAKCKQTAEEESQKGQVAVNALRDELAVLVERAAQAERSVSECPAGISASVESCSLAALGIEAEEDAEACGDASTELLELITKHKACQAFRMGRIHLPAAAEAMSVSSPACAKVVLRNSGTAPWPQTTVIGNVEGANMGQPIMVLGHLEPGEVKEIEMDLAARLLPEAGLETRSLWAIVDGASGARLGPLLVFEVVWDLA